LTAEGIPSSKVRLMWVCKVFLSPSSGKSKCSPILLFLLVEKPFYYNTSLKSSENVKFSSYKLYNITVLTYISPLGLFIDRLDFPDRSPNRIFPIPVQPLHCRGRHSLAAASSVR